MTVRLLAIAVVGVVLMGYAPRWLVLSSEAWIIWVAAAAIVYGGPRLLRRAGKSALGQLQAGRETAAGFAKEAINSRIPALANIRPLGRGAETRARAPSPHPSDR